MFYHLNELYGITKWFDKFKIFALTEQHVNGKYSLFSNRLLNKKQKF